MKIQIDAFQTQKAGNAESEYEDAFWPRVQNMTVEESNVRIAVADGATDAVYSGLWAQLLVRAYGRRRLTGETVQIHLGKAARVWERIVRRRPLPWYSEEKARAGSFAALVGLALPSHS
jgi:serine/threonine protein phosphatase PrpC